MKLAANFSYINGHYGLEKGMQAVKDAGFDAIDHSLETMIRPDSPFLLDGWREKCENIRRVADETGIDIIQTHAPFNFDGKKICRDEENYKKILIPTQARAIEISAIFGAKHIIVHALHHSYTSGETWEESFARNLRYYRDLLPYAKEFGVKIAVENLWCMDPVRKVITYDCCSTPEEQIRYIDTLDSEYAVGCLDTGHVGLVPRPTDLTAGDLARLLGHDRLQCLHVHDNDFRGDQHMLPYTGKIDWADFTKALGEIDYQGDFTYELGGSFLGTMDDEFMPTGMKYMVDVGRHLMSLVERNRPKG